MLLDGTIDFAAPGKHATHQSDCSKCPSQTRCLIAEVSDGALAQWNVLVEGTLALAQSGQSLFEMGDRFDALYVVRAGCVKTLTIDADGQERVRAFHLRGDLLGLDSLASSCHTSTAVAVEPSQLCRIPRAAAMQKLAESPELLVLLLKGVSADLDEALCLSGEFTAEQRLAAFLLRMQQRMHLPVDKALPLHMTRRDIANHLRLAAETVCRVLTRFATRGLIRSGHGSITLLNGSALQALAAPLFLPRKQALTLG